jgi:hypothetical protein
MKMKSAIMFVVLASGLTASVFATESVVPTSLNHASQSDVLSLFEADSRPLQLAVLSPQEMKETEGAFGPWGAVGGGIIGGIGNIGYQLGASNGWNWGSFGYAVGSGALTGFTGGAAAWYVVPRVAFFGGVAAGRLGW